MNTLYLTLPPQFPHHHKTIDQLFDALMDGGVPSVVTSQGTHFTVFVSTQHLADGENALDLARAALKAAGFPAQLSDVSPSVEAANDPLISPPAPRRPVMA